MRRCVPAVGVAAAVGAVLLAGCGSEPDPAPTVSKEQLQTIAKDKLETAAGAQARSVECEDGVAGKVGALQRCVLTAGDGSRIGVTATVTKVEGENVSFDVVADDAPLP